MEKWRKLLVEHIRRTIAWTYLLLHFLHLPLTRIPNKLAQILGGGGGGHGVPLPRDVVAFDLDRRHFSNLLSREAVKGRKAE